MKEKKPIYKKKSFWIIAVIAIIIIGCVAGGGSDDNEKKTKEATKDTTKDASGSVDESKEVTCEKQVLLDKDGVIVTATGLDSSLMGDELTVHVENHSKKNITVQADNVSVNDVMTDSLFSCDVAPGKSSNDSITFLSSDFKAAGIKTIGKIELTLKVLNDSFETVASSKNQLIKTSAYDSYKQDVDDTGFEAVNKKGYRIVVKKLDSEDSFWGADIYVYIENNTKKAITVQADDVSVNGLMIMPAFSCDVAAGKKAFSTITLLEDDLKKNKIEDITEMELKFNVLNKKTFSTLYQSKSIKVSFQ